MTKYVLVYDDPQCELFDTKAEAEERAEELISGDGFDSTDADTIRILEVTKAWTVSQTKITTKEVSLNKLDTDFSIDE